MSTTQRILSVATAVAAVTSFGLAGCARHAETSQTAALPPARSDTVVRVEARATVRAPTMTTRRTLLDASVGGTAGALISARMDRQASELARSLRSAKVERVGEGIQITFESGLLYDMNSDVVRPEARRNLRALAASLNQYPGSSVLVVGHTDNTGTAAYNLALSERRAAAAADYLVVLGVNKDRIDTRGMGEREPIASNDTERGRELNRRLEVAIFASEEYRAEVAAR
jgi:outer membrane protein OmpA-like peptidoglycan-associated protein